MRSGLTRRSEEHGGSGVISQGSANRVETIQPIAPFKGMLWMDGSIQKVYDGSSFVPIGATAMDHNHTTALNDGGVLTNDLHDGYSQYAKISTPTSPPANSIRWFTRLNGSMIDVILKSALGECVVCSLQNTSGAGLSGQLMGTLGLTYS